MLTYVVKLFTFPIAYWLSSSQYIFPIVSLNAGNIQLLNICHNSCRIDTLTFNSNLFSTDMAVLWWIQKKSECTAAFQNKSKGKDFRPNEYTKWDSTGSNCIRMAPPWDTLTQRFLSWYKNSTEQTNDKSVQHWFQNRCHHFSTGFAEKQKTVSN